MLGGLFFETKSLPKECLRKAGGMGEAPSVESG